MPPYKARITKRKYLRTSRRRSSGRIPGPREPNGRDFRPKGEKPFGRFPGTSDPMNTKFKAPGTKDENEIIDQNRLQPRRDRRV